VQVIGGLDNPHREGVITMAIKGRDSADIVSQLSAHGIRVHVRKADHYSGNILTPLGLETGIRVSLCHYNTAQEVAEFLRAMKAIVLAD
ncbi:MAG: aminotransferase class V-fold PLP-dependent enzyme, partial [Alphaproteobacteria bacterium]